MTFAATGRFKKVIPISVLIGGVVVFYLMSPYEADGVDLLDRLSGPSLRHPLGTDSLGRDVTIRLIDGSAVTLGSALMSLVATGLIGTALGLVAGWRGGVVANGVVLLTDSLVTIPSIVVALIIVSIVGPGLTGSLVAMTATGWLPFARLTLQLTRRIMLSEFVDAARLTGASTAKVLTRTVFPNIRRPIVAHAFLRFPNKLIFFSGLSFLGLGPQPPSAEWGSMLAEGIPELERAPILVLAPGTCIVVCGMVASSIGRRYENNVETRSIEL